MLLLNKMIALICGPVMATSQQQLILLSAQQPFDMSVSVKQTHCNKDVVVRH